MTLARIKGFSAKTPCERRAAALLKARALTVAVAESCTGGLVSHMLTNVAGSSGWFLGGVVAYAGTIKTELLGVPAQTLKKHGPVSRSTASAMARGVRERLGSDVAVAITGIAGPEGGTPRKPVGTVFIAVAYGKKIRIKRFSFTGSRQQIKKNSAQAALNTLCEILEKG